MTYTTKDSGERSAYDSGMVRDTEKGKARFDLILPIGIPYAEQMLTRFADLMARGADKYDERNWELARGEEELARYKSSALRHLIQWVTGEDDEDHAAAVMFNLLAGETVKYRLGEPTDLPMVGCCRTPCDKCSEYPYLCIVCKPGCPCLTQVPRVEYVTCSDDYRPHEKSSSCRLPIPAEGC